MPTSPKFQEGEFQLALEKVRRDLDASASGKSRPDFDAKQFSEYKEFFIGGKKIEDFHAVLEFHGFKKIPRNLLPLWENGQPREDDEWRRSFKLNGEIFGMAFTDTDLLAGWKGPEDFDTWIRKYLLRKQLAPLGIQVP